MPNPKEYLRTCSSSIERLFLLGGRRASRHPGIEYDITIAQDIFHGRIGLGDIQALMLKEHDFSWSGDSLASWLYRIGGDNAVIDWLSRPDTDKYHAIIVAGWMVSDPIWIRNLAKSETDPGHVLMLAERAFQREDSITLDLLRERLPLLIEPERDYNHAAYLRWAESITENDVMLRNLKAMPSKPAWKPVAYEHDPRLQSIPKSDLRGMVTREEISYEEMRRRRLRLEEQVYRQRRRELREFVSYAISQKDLALLDAYLLQDIQNEEEGKEELFTQEEREILEIGRDHIQKALISSLPIPPIYGIGSDEAYQLFQKMSARYTREQYEEGDIPSAEDDYAFWLVMRLGQLGAISLLKEIIKHKEYRIEARQEAVRQLILAGERKFLKGYCLLANGPVDMWKTKEVFSLKDDAESWKQHNTVLERLTSSLPAYISAIVEG